MTSVSGWSMVRGLVSTSLPNTNTSSPTAKYFSMNGRFHQRQCSRAVPSSRMNSKTDLLPPRKRFNPARQSCRASWPARPCQFGDVAEMPAILVTPRRVQEQIFDRENAEPGQLRRAFSADAPKRGDRHLERRNFVFRRRHRPNDTNRSARLQRERKSDTFQRYGGAALLLSFSVTCCSTVRQRITIPDKNWALHRMRATPGSVTTSTNTRWKALAKTSTTSIRRASSIRWGSTAMP